MESRVQWVSELGARVVQDPALAARLKENPVETLENLAAPLQTGVWIYRIVVGALVLAMAGKPVPEVVGALGAVAVGALAGLLSPSPTNR